MSTLIQNPAHGTHRVYHAGDVFCMTLSGDIEGEPWVRTNLGQAAVRRAEIIARVETQTPLANRDWRDLPMSRQEDGSYSFVYPLSEVGRFEAKCFVMSPGDASTRWPEGDNVVIKVEPAECRADNSMYCAFARQFGEQRRHLPEGMAEDSLASLEALGYAVLPPSGKFRDLAESLDIIMGEMGFRIIQLLPIHPTPTTYARMGRYGSPYASQDYEEVDPALAEFDRKTTPLEQFGELVDAVHRREGRVFLDIPINHTGWASRLQIHHPDWFVREDDRTFRSPGAWGVTWEDLSKLDYSNRDLWIYMADMFLYWCRQGVDGFRCDAGYKVPVPVWQYIVAKVRAQCPDTVFFLEGLGGPLKTVAALLDKANLNWAYSELFQTYARDHLESYLPQSLGKSRALGMNVHFAETHDNTRLAAQSAIHSRMRCALSALCSHAGGFGITNGVEWYATERVNVHGASSLAWGQSPNQVDFLARLTFLLEHHPCFDADAECHVITRGFDNVLVMRRHNAPHDVVVVVNLSSEESATARWQSDSAMSLDLDVYDLLGEKPVNVNREGDECLLALAPGQACCLAPAPFVPDPSVAPAYERQHVRATVNRVLHFFDRINDPVSDHEDMASFIADPLRIVPTLPGSDYRPVIRWQWPQDAHRTVLLPSGHALYVSSAEPFRCDLRDGDVTVVRQRSIASAGAGETGKMHFAFLVPCVENAGDLLLDMAVYDSPSTRHATSVIRVLPSSPSVGVHQRLTGAAFDPDSHYAIACNGINTFAQVRGRWGRLESQYDALLSGNMHSAFPVDRLVSLTRCRAWVVYRGYSRSLEDARHLSFEQRPEGDVIWRLEVPVGGGQCVRLGISHSLATQTNAAQLRFTRETDAHPDMLDRSSAVALILRPDVEQRGHHEKTKAYEGADARWPTAVQVGTGGFVFDPYGAHALHVEADAGTYVHEPEWYYMIPHPVEADRGLDGASDLFSPGYFRSLISAGDTLHVTARLSGGNCDTVPAWREPPVVSDTRDTEDLRPTLEALSAAMQHFIVRSDALKTVIAGFPWFLDWGRDTLICLRGLISAGWHEDAATILTRFALYEERGTLPNIMQGETIGNRDTSDAPLWFITVCGELLDTDAVPGLLDAECGERTLREVLVSIGSHYLSGTSNGISVDADSGLVFSPSHFTWMDTNYPAGTPREGYPIEIQALWYASLRVLARIDEQGEWAGLCNRVQESVHQHFALPDRAYLSDCLHAKPGQSAADATADDCLRCNQLFAITLGLVDDRALQCGILDACQALLVPGAIRSLADQAVSMPLPVYQDSGRLLNDPGHPYQGHYRGDEDTCRKPAYHNGTAWSWPFPSYPEALLRVYGESAREIARAILLSTESIMNAACLGQIPEILDGNAPHAQRGCGAQAWGATEFYRVLAMLAQND